MRAKRLTQKPTRSMTAVVIPYTNQVPLPARAKTRGMVSEGEVEGAMVETDWARVSSGERTAVWRP